MSEITLLRSGNNLVVDPTPVDVAQSLSDALTYQSMRMLYGKEKKMAGGKQFTYDTWRCYDMDIKNRFYTSFGFYKRITRILKSMGYDVKYKHLTPHEKPQNLQPKWDKLFDSGIELRPRQDEFLARAATLIQKQLPGRFDLPTAWGKSFMLTAIGRLFPKAKIVITSTRVPVLRDRIFPELVQMLPDVGIICSGKKRTGHRIMCITSGSLHHYKDDADILIADEVHEMAADRASAQVARFTTTTNIGLSATHDMRLDNKDMRIEGMFGPLVMRVSYQEAQKSNMVVPIEVHWRNVIMDYDPCEGADDPIEKKRRGVWRNKRRNEIIAEDARKDFNAGRQTLITCETIDHAVRLKQLLPEFELVYAENGMDDAHRQRYTEQGLLEPSEPVMTLERRYKLTELFERGKLLGAIATPVWNVGVNFKKLNVLIRADAGSSPTMDTQIPGRVARLNDGKEMGILRDYLDQFNTGFKNRAARRRNNYEKHGWAQVFPDGYAYSQRSRNSRQQPTG